MGFEPLVMESIGFEADALPIEPPGPHRRVTITSLSRQGAFGDELDPNRLMEWTHWGGRVAVLCLPSQAAVPREGSRFLYSVCHLTIAVLQRTVTCRKPPLTVQCVLVLRERKDTRWRSVVLFVEYRTETVNVSTYYK